MLNDLLSSLDDKDIKMVAKLVPLSNSNFYIVEHISKANINKGICIVDVIRNIIEAKFTTEYVYIWSNGYLQVYLLNDALVSMMDRYGYTIEHLSDLAIEYIKSFLQQCLHTTNVLNRCKTNNNSDIDIIDTSMSIISLDME